MRKKRLLTYRGVEVMLDREIDRDPQQDMSDAEWFQLDMEQWWEQTKHDEVVASGTYNPEEATHEQSISK